jgi:hypothetical protein
MKRVLTFDFLRGIAIIGVLLFHVLNIAFSQRVEEIGNALDGTGTVELYWYILAPILLVLGAFNGLFLMVSAASNSISVHKQWERMVVEKGIDKNAAFKSIFVSQLIRGALIWSFGYLSEHVIATGLVAMINFYLGKPIDDPGMSFLKGLFLTNILYTIGISIVITSFIQLLYLRNGISRKTISWILIVITIACTALMPVVKELNQALFKTDTFSNGLEATGAGEMVLRFFLAPILGRLTPLIPFFSCASAGLLIAININDNAIKPSTLRKFLYSGLIFVCASFIAGLALGDIGLGEREKSVFYQMFIIGLEIMSVSYLVYMIDFRKKTNIEKFARYTTWARRFGIMTLTLWMLQYFMIFPVALIELITGWPIIEGGLVDWQLGMLLLILFGMWHSILWAWEKGRFIGSFEWLTALALSGNRSSGDRMQMDGILYNPEKMIQHVTETERKVDSKERALIITNLTFAGLYALVIILVAVGIVEL